MEFANVKLFAKDSTDLYDAIKEYSAERIKERKGQVAFASHSKDEMHKLINKAFAEEVARRANMELPNVDDKTSVQRFASLTTVREMAEETRNVMIDAIIPDILIDSPLQYIADVQFADYGDTVKFDIKSNQLLTVSKAGNRQRNTNVQKTFASDVTLSGENHEISLHTNLYDIIVGRSYIAEEIMKAALAIENDMLDSAYDAFVAAMTGLGGSALEVTNYGEKSLITLCEKVGAYNGGAKPVILGTPVALKDVLPANTNYRYFLDSEYVKMGHVNVFNTYDVIPMAQKADALSTTPYALKFDDNKLYVVSPASDKLVKLAVFGGTMSREDSDTANKAVLHTIEANYSAAVITNSVAGVVSSMH